MKRIEGYVCVAVLAEKMPFPVCQLFGVVVDQSMKDEGYEAITTNGLKPFDSINEALAAATKLRERDDIGSVWIGRMKLKLSESKEENLDPLFRRSRSLIIVVEEEFPKGHRRLFGPAVEGVPQTCNEYCSELQVNGRRRFSSWRFVRWPLREVIRLTGGLPTRLATFSLKRVE